MPRFNKLKIILALLVGIVSLSVIYLINKNLSQKQIITKRAYEIEIPKNKEECEVKNGKWEKIGLNPKEQCNLPTSDASRECFSSKECQSRCLADLTEEEKAKNMQGVTINNVKGKCTPWRIVVGCLFLVEGGKVSGMVCLD